MNNPLTVDKTPYIIEFGTIGSSEIGYISVAQFPNNLPFKIERVFWSYYTPQMITRGRHAHFRLEQILVAVSGKIIVTNESLSGNITTHILESPSQGLFIPSMYWHVIQFSHNAVMMSLTSMLYEESDYIRDYNEFKKLNTAKK
jgi:hypothetical protein